METADNTGKADSMDKVDNMDSRIHKGDHRLYWWCSVLPTRAVIPSRHMESTLYAATYVYHDTHYDNRAHDTHKRYHHM